MKLVAVRVLMVGGLLLGLSCEAWAAPPVRPDLALEFSNLQPCPASGEIQPRCKGHVVRHVRPLACGGADELANLEWQTRQQARSSDLAAKRDCRDGKRRGSVDGLRG